MDFLPILLIIIIIVLILIFGDKKSAIDTYTYYIENSTLDPDFVAKTTQILQASGWNKKYKIAPATKENAIITIKLVPREVMLVKNPPRDKYPDGTPIYFSFTVQSPTKKPEIWIDGTNWLEGVKQSGLSIEDYKTYVINHEFGHALGIDHTKCTSSPCPVMWQSTRGCGKFECGKHVSNGDFTAPVIARRYRE